MSRQVKLDPAEVRRLARTYGFNYEVLAEKLPQIARGVLIAAEVKQDEPDTDWVERYIWSMRTPAAALLSKLDNFPKNIL